jgi:hypothetical protein
MLPSVLFEGVEDVLDHVDAELVLGRLLEHEDIQLLLAGCPKGLNAKLGGVVKWGIQSEDVLVVCRSCEVKDVGADEANILEDLLLGILADDSQWTIHLSSVGINIELKHIEPRTHGDDLKGVIGKLGLEGFERLVLLRVVVDHIAEVRIHRFNGEYENSRSKFANMLKAVFVGVLGFIHLVWDNLPEFQVIDHPLDLFFDFPVVNS